jgi:hypothetical protein
MLRSESIRIDLEPTYQIRIRTSPSLGVFEMGIIVLVPIAQTTGAQIALTVVRLVPRRSEKEARTRQILRRQFRVSRRRVRPGDGRDSRASCSLGFGVLRLERLETGGVRLHVIYRLEFTGFRRGSIL